MDASNLLGKDKLSMLKLFKQQKNKFKVLNFCLFFCLYLVNNLIKKKILKNKIYKLSTKQEKSSKCSSKLVKGKILEQIHFLNIT